MATSAAKKEGPIYEKLEPDQCLILEREADEIVYACNEKGKITVRRARIPRGG